MTCSISTPGWYGSPSPSIRRARGDRRAREGTRGAAPAPRAGTPRRRAAVAAADRSSAGGARAGDLPHDRRPAYVSGERQRPGRSRHRPDRRPAPPGNRRRHAALRRREPLQSRLPPSSTTLAQRSPTRTTVRGRRRLARSLWLANPHLSSTVASSAEHAAAALRTAGRAARSHAGRARSSYVASDFVTAEGTAYERPVLRAESASHHQLSARGRPATSIAEASHSGRRERRATSRPV